MAESKNKKRRPAKFTGGAKITITALSLFGFVSGWNLIARMETSEAQAGGPTATPLPSPQPVTLRDDIVPTPWPTIAPLPQLKPIPTLVPTLTTSGAITVQTQPAVNNLDLTPVQLAPLPTMAPLPPMPETPPPPPPPPPPMPAGGWQQSGGS